MRSASLNTPSPLPVLRSTSQPAFFILIFFSFLSFGSKSQNDLPWSKKMEPSLEIRGSGSSVLDNAGNIYITGVYYQACDFDPGQAEFRLTPVYGKDIFVCKFSPTGNLLWAKDLGNGEQWQGSLAVDTEQNLLVAGNKSGLYMAKLDLNGNLIWEKQLSGYFGDVKVLADKENNFLVYGNFIETGDFDPGPGEYYLEGLGFGEYSVAYQTGFLLKLDPAGYFVWAQRFETNKKYSAMQASTGKKAIYLKYDLDNNGIAVKKLSEAGNLLWSKTFEGMVQICAMEETVDKDLLCTGYFSEKVDFDPGENVFQMTTTYEVVEHHEIKYADRDMFMLQLDGDGNLDWAKQVSGPGWEGPSDMTFGEDGNIYISGTCNVQTDFDPGVGVYSIPTERKYNGFFSVYAKDGKLLCANSVYAGAHPYVNTGVYSIHTDAQNRIYTVTGSGQYGFYINKLIECRPAEPIKVLPAKEKFRVFPNPTAGQIEVRADMNYTFRLVDVTGRILYEGIIPEGINVLNFDRFFGVFYLQLIAPEQTTVLKVVIN
jgi:hypothetical protein